MSQQFLNQILTMENAIVGPLVAPLLQVRSDPDQNCCICLQEIGTLSTETGIIEIALRLPCSHLVGSACIATWLRSNNTCPVCRRVFFPAQPQPDLGWDLDLPYFDEADIVFICGTFCIELGVSHQARDTAQEMAEMWEHVNWLPDHAPRHVAATIVYIVSHIMREAVSLVDISEVSGISVDDIRSSYALIQLHREQLIQPHMLRDLGRDYLERILAFLPALRPEDGFIDLEGDDDETSKGSDLEYHLMPTRTEQLEELCERCCTELGYEQHVMEMCHGFALKILLGSHLPGYSPLPIAAVSLYIVNHLVDLQTALRQISDVVGVSEGTIRDSYRRVYRYRGELFGLQILVDLGRCNLRRAILVLGLPAL